MLNRLHLTILFVLVQLATFAQTGTIKGYVKDAKTEEPIIGANVSLEGTTTGSSVEVDGSFIINKVPVGTFNVLVSFVSYKTQKIENIKVEAGKVVVLNVPMQEDAQEIEGVTVTGARETAVEIAVISEIRMAEQVISGISAEQITRSQDRDASEVMRRMPGVTIFDNRFVMIRGLNERYNSVMLNEALATSSEVDKKAFSFDLIPSNMIDRLLIYKSGAPELPAEMAGGVIKVFTKNVPDRNEFSINLSTSYRANTTFNDFYSNSPSSTDKFGFDNGDRALPSNFPSSLGMVGEPNTLAQLGKSLPNTWTADKTTANPDLRFSMNFARSFDVKKLRISTINSINYSNTSVSYTAPRYNYNEYNLAAQKSDTIVRFIDKQYDNNVRVGILSNWSFLISPYHKIEFKNLFNQIGASQVTNRTGASIEEGFDVQNYAYRYENRSVYSGQLLGQHEFNEGKTKFEWASGYSYSYRAEPDFKRMRTVRNINSNSDIPFELIVAPAASTLDAGRFYSKLTENVLMVNGNLEHKFRKGTDGEEVPTLKVGFYVEHKDRDFSARWMSYKKARSSQFDSRLTKLPLSTVFNPENINPTTGFSLEEGTNFSDKYTASNLLIAGYAGLSLPVSSKFHISGGLRIEDNTQQLKSRNYSNEAVEPKLAITSFLPSLNLSYDLTEHALLRMAYSKTLNRPEFRELAPFSFYDFGSNNVIVGNNNLTIANIHNVDLRWEYYPSPSETISIAAFYKYFKNPIETYFVPGSGSGGTRNFTFDNADYATSAGLELEVRKSLAGTDLPVLKDMSLVLNASVIQSEVKLGDKARGQESNRPMMGQSPYVINTGLYYFNDAKDLQINLLYNVLGKRIFAVGTVGTPNIYEMPRNVVDLTVTKGLTERLEMRFGIQDLLNQRILLIQDSNGDDKIEEGKDEKVTEYRRGQYSTLSISYRF